MRSLPFALLLVAACGGGGKTAPAPAPSPPPAPVGGSKADLPPALARHTGATKVNDVAATGKVTGRFEDARAVYVAVDVDGDAVPRHTDWIQVDAGGLHALAVRSENPNRILVRLPGKKLPDSLGLVWTAGSESWDGIKGGERRSLKVTGIAAAPKEPKLDIEYFQGAASWFAEHGRGRDWGTLSFYAYASGRMTYLADSRQPKGSPAVPRRAPSTELGRLMDLYTGMTSVDEAMQSDRGLLLAAEAGGPMLPADAAKPLVLPAHPWDKMIAELPGKPSPVIEPLAKSVPADFLYLGAQDLRRLVLLARALDRYAPIAALLEQRGASAEMIARLERELAVERTGLAEKLGHIAAGGVALVASDPFFREGTDVSLLFLVKNEALLGGALGEFATRSGGTWSDVTIAGKKVRLLSTPDGRVRRYELRLGDVLILSNSPGALARLVEVAEGKRPNLAASGEFRYFRALYPAKPDEEDAFAFASDAFIQSVVSPRTKILEARRLAGRADVMAVNHAAMLHGWLEGKLPDSAVDLAKSGLGAIPYTGITYSPEAGAEAVRWGNAVRLTPIIDLELGKISTAERDAYERFRETYQSYWRGYVDPIGARFKVDANGKVSFDARMLPLISGTDYDKIRRQVGDRTVQPPVAKAGAHFVLAVGDDAMLRRELDRAARSFGRSSDFGIGWLGDWVAVGAADRNALWDLALMSRAVPELEPRARDGIADRRAFERKLWPRLPLYAMAHVRSKVGLVATLAAIRKYIDDAAPGILDWGPGAAYRGVETVRVAAKPGADVDELAELALHYGVAGEVLVIAVDRSTFEHAVDMVLDGRAAKPAKAGAPAMQTVISVEAPLGGPMRRTALAMAEELARRDARSAGLQWEAVTRGKVKDAARWTGETPVAAVGGEFGFDDDGAVRHSVYGSIARPVVPEGLPEDSALVIALSRLAGFKFGLAFEGKGDHQGLRSVGELR